MALSWNEIKDRALKFSKEWAGTVNEEANAKPFLVEFFNVFGITSKRVSSFEHKVKKLGERDGYIDLLWKGMILIEMKSRGKSLDKAYQQAIDYLHGLKELELPKFILVCDFEIFRLYDLEESSFVEFKLDELVNNVQHFGSLIGYQRKIYQEQDPANIKAAELMGALYDQLKAIGYEGHPLEVYLVRILFCLFADDTTIFERNQFQEFLEQRTSDDGSDLAARLQELFQVLNTPKENRFKNLDEQLDAFPYVNGNLFGEFLPMASFDSKMRMALLKCCRIDWSKISPAIFGSMFQSVMNPKERRNLGAHYTSEKNILKLIKPLFLDELWEEFEILKDNRNRLIEFHRKLSKLTFLDPACGCGNFLIITYRELRLLEIEVIKRLQGNQQVTSIDALVNVSVNQFYGIEYEEFPARIAEVAMWLIDHQMNMMVGNEFGQYFVRLPLRQAATIVNGNALRLDWRDLLQHQYSDIEANETTLVVNEPCTDYATVNIRTRKLTIIDQRAPSSATNAKATAFDYIIGNPPFIGYAWQSQEQKTDMASVFSGVKGAGVLDYVTAWYVKAAQLIQNTKAKVAFVSTNSISQGEQPGILWNFLFNYYQIKIHFAHRTFSWSNEARGKAAVHVVIIGFANYDTPQKKIFEYDNPKGEPHEVKARNINPYLVDAKDIILHKRNNPICNVPEINRGSDAIDDGNLLLSQEERDLIISKYPDAVKMIKPFLMGKEFINNIPRYCIWLKGINLAEMREMKLIYDRVENVRVFRKSSRRPQTLKAAQFPYLFGEERQPISDYLAIPKVSSENREYIPIAYCSKDIICGDKLFNLPDATLFHFGIITSKMHMTWMRATCGRLESRYSYSNTIVYNNFPWPEIVNEKYVKAIETAAQKVLNARGLFPDSSFAILYDPITMPPELVQAHNELDRTVDNAYRTQPFTSEANRLEFLFSLYEKYTADLFTTKNQKKPRRK
jgi:type I restriction-modification system DNA methylase subunit